MKRLALPIFCSAVILIALPFGCTKDKTPRPEEDPNNKPCDPNVVYYETEIKPILTANCAMSGCHDAATRQDGVDLSSYEGIRAQVDPGDPGDSEIIEKINEEDAEDRMPPPPRAPLTPDQKALLFTWIQQGAANTTCSQDTAGCNPTAVSFANDIQPIISNNCIGCHSGSVVNAGVNLSSHGGVQAAAQTGRLYNAVSQNGQATPMPPSGKLPSCDISKIKAWIDEGMKNN